MIFTNKNLSFFNSACWNDTCKTQLYNKHGNKLENIPQLGFSSSFFLSLNSKDSILKFRAFYTFALSGMTSSPANGKKSEIKAREWQGSLVWVLMSLNTERAYKRSAVCTLLASFAPIMAAFCNGHYRYKSSAKSLVVCFQEMIH